MQIKSRITHNFVELKVDEVETTIFKNSQEPIETIENLLSVIEDLCRLTDRHFHYEIKENSEL